MKKIDIYLVEYFNENENCWEWGNVVRQSEYTEEYARISTFADNHGVDFNSDTFTGEKEDIEYVKNNWEDNTRAWSLKV